MSTSCIASLFRTGMRASLEVDMLMHRNVYLWHCKCILSACEHHCRYTGTFVSHSAAIQLSSSCHLALLCSHPVPLRAPNYLSSVSHSAFIQLSFGFDLALIRLSSEADRNLNEMSKNIGGKQTIRKLKLT